MLKKLALPALFAGALTFAAVSAAPTPAEAGKKTRNFLLGLGVGVATTALIASAIHQNKKRKWERRHYRSRYRHRPYYRYRPRPWTPEWYDYCMSKYRSFNPETGYYRTYSGRYRFCR